MNKTRVKLQKVDEHARAKGFRRGQVRNVVAYDADANPRRGCLYFVMDRKGRFEGFYRDQFRFVSQSPAHTRIPFSEALKGLPPVGKCNYNEKVYAK